MAPYYIALLTDLLGPVTSVDGAAAVTRAVRTIGAPPRAGETFVARSPTHVTALLRLAGTVTATLTTSFDAPVTAGPHVEIYGTEGTLALPDPNLHSGPVRLWRVDEPRWREIPQAGPAVPAVPAAPAGVHIGRGIGVLNTAAALRGTAPHRTTGRHALHVLETMVAIEEAAGLA
jgi:predicted dehydrogenase